VSALVDVFEAERGALAPAERAAVDELLGRAVAEARAAWPGVSVAAEEFVRHLAVCLAGAAPLEALPRLHAADLYLALACGRGEPAAVDAFEKTQLAALAGTLASVDSSAEFADEVRQQLRVRLLMPPPQILGYSGRGALAAWLRVAALRTALNLRRDRAPRALPTDGDGDGALVDPELALIKAQYRSGFKAAFARAVASLDAEDRSLLRLHLIERLSIDELGALLQVHRATAARRIAHCRTQLLERTEAELAQALGVRSDEVESVIGLVRSQLDLSLHGLLASRE
jgi:RNA polymerase sigma-70 factor (ECF subfamily)